MSKLLEGHGISLQLMPHSYKTIDTCSDAFAMASGGFVYMAGLWDSCFPGPP